VVRILNIANLTIFCRFLRKKKKTISNIQHPISNDKGKGKESAIDDISASGMSDARKSQAVFTEGDI